MVNDLPLSPLPRDRLPRFLITRPRLGADIGAVLGAGGGRRLSASSKVKVYLNNQITNTQRLSSRNTFISISMHQGDKYTDFENQGRNKLFPYKNNHLQ